MTPKRNLITLFRNLGIAVAVLTMSSHSLAQVRLNSSREWLNKTDLDGLGLSKQAVVRIKLELEISESGIVRKCEAYSSPASSKLGAHLCARAKERAHYVPAQDATGGPISTHDRVVYLVWDRAPHLEMDFGGARIVAGEIRDSDYPAQAKSLAQQGDVVMLFDIDAAGDVQNCRVVLSSNSPSLDRKSCELVTSRFKFQPPVGARGQPAATNAQFRISWRL